MLHQTADQIFSAARRGGHREKNNFTTKLPRTTLGTGLVRVVWYLDIESLSGLARTIEKEKSRGMRVARKKRDASNLLPATAAAQQAPMIYLWVHDIDAR